MESAEPEGAPLNRPSEGGNQATPEFEIEDPGTATYAEISKRFDAYNRVHTNWDWTTFSVTHRLDGRIVASARGVTNMGLVEIRGFWVDEDLRKQGIGSAMMAALEAEALRRGCTRAALDTYSWQALDFYDRLGFAQYATLDYPNGTSRHYLVKDLVSA